MIELPLTASSSPARHILIAPAVPGELGEYRLALSFDGEDVGEPQLVSSLLPTSRSVSIGSTATAFATVINTTDRLAANCVLTPQTDIPAEFFYQRTDPATNAPVGARNEYVTIQPREFQTFVFGFTPNASFSPTDVVVAADCRTGKQAAVVTGLNTLLLSASTAPVADLVALAATTSNDGVVSVSGPAGLAAFAVASVNVGAGASITVSADTGVASLPLELLLCETDPVTSECINPVVPGNQPITRTIETNGTPTFAVFVRALQAIPFDPANHRIFVRFLDDAGVTRGATSVAVRTDAP